MESMKILQHYVRPSMGCTDPGAVALVAASAAQAAGGEVQRTEVVLDPMLLRNALAVAVPNAGGDVGLAIAAALGAVGGDATLGLEVLREASADDVDRARVLVSNGDVSVRMNPAWGDLHVEALVRTSAGVGRAVIEGSHTNITLLERNGESLLSQSGEARRAEPAADQGVATWMRQASLTQLVQMAEALPKAVVHEVLDGVYMNLRAAQEGLRSGPGLGLGARLARVAKNTACGAGDLSMQAQSLSAAAVDARMAGLPVGVMTSSGSGNQGITVTLPAWAVVQGLELDDDRLGRAVALGHLLLARMREELGVLSALCGAAVHAAAASAGAVTWLLGGDAQHVEQSVCTVLGTQIGVLCDGAKAGCALKVAQGAELAVETALLCLADQRVPPGNGLLGKCFDETLADVAALAQSLQPASERVLQIIARGA